MQITKVPIKQKITVNIHIEEMWKSFMKNMTDVGLDTYLDDSGKSFNKTISDVSAALLFDHEIFNFNLPNYSQLKETEQVYLLRRLFTDGYAPLLVPELLEYLSEDNFVTVNVYLTFDLATYEGLIVVLSNSEIEF